jgi:hypothetical protein
MIMFRRRGWIALLLLLLCIAIPGMTLHQDLFQERIAMAGLLLLSATFIYWFGTRSMRQAEEYFEQPLPWYGRIFDYWGVSPFDSLGSVHLRWWAIAFVGGAVYAGITAYG